MSAPNDKARILIVDDVPANIMTLVAILGSEYQLLVAKNGRKALDIVATKPVDLILLDVLMPEMDGYETIEQLQKSETSKDIPVIFVTSKYEVSDEARALELGAVDFVTKPVSPPVVRARVRTHLGLKQARETLERQNQELVVARELLEDQNRQLLKSAALREDVDCIMRHDLKTPLNAIIGLSHFLHNSLGMDERKSKMCQVILESGYRLLDLINLSLDLYKMEQGIYRLEPRSVELLVLLGKVIESNTEHHATGQAVVDLTLEGRPPRQTDAFVVLAEELLCYSMFNNLIKNAVEASPEGERIRVDLTRKEMAEIRIENVGEVPVEIRDRFFDKYVTSGKQMGTGLGTYSSKLMANSQNGNVRLLSSEGNTTVIVVTLPSE